MLTYSIWPSSLSQRASAVGESSIGQYVVRWRRVRASSSQRVFFPLPLPSSAPEVTPETLEKIEESVHSPHLKPPSEQTDDVDSARHEVMQALQDGTQPLEPLTALNANPLGGELHTNQVEIDMDGNLIAKSSPSVPTAPNNEITANVSTPLDMPLPSVAPGQATTSPSPQPNAASVSPPPVPPPFMPPPMNSSQ